MALSTLFAPLGMKIAGGIAAAAVLAFGVQTVRLSSAHASLESKTEQLGAEKLKLQVSNSSIAMLEAALEGKNNETVARAIAYEESKERLLASGAENDVKFEGTMRRVEEILSRVGQTDGQCLTPSLGDLP